MLQDDLVMGWEFTICVWLCDLANDLTLVFAWSESGKNFLEHCWDQVRFPPIFPLRFLSSRTILWLWLGLFMKLRGCLASISFLLSAILNSSQSALHVTGLCLRSSAKKKIYDFEKLRWVPWIFMEPKNWYRWFPMIIGYRTEKLFFMGFKKNLSPLPPSLSKALHFLMIIFILKEWLSLTGRNASFLTGTC